MATLQQVGSLTAFVLYKNRAGVGELHSLYNSTLTHWVFSEIFSEWISLKAWFLQGTKLVLAVTQAYEELGQPLKPCCAGVWEKNLPRTVLALVTLSADALFEWPWRNRKADSVVPLR